MDAIRNFLEHIESMSPIPTKAKYENKLDKSTAVKAIIFDIYGTLLISASGDIHELEQIPDHLKIALETGDYGFPPMEREAERENMLMLQTFFYSEIENQQNKLISYKGIEYPEIDIRDIWENTIQYGIEKKVVFRRNTSNALSALMMFELLNNPIYPMPYMKDLIEYLQQKNYVIGFVSNAQFYTPIFLNFFLENQFELSNSILDIDPSLNIFSYNYSLGKPNPELFKIIGRNLYTRYKITPEETIYVGNDMLKDIYPAQSIGMKTALFAGDKRSYRLRKNYPDLNDIEPDIILTELNQLTQIV